MRIGLLGLPGSGKTSIENIVFHKHLDKTNTIRKKHFEIESVDVNSFSNIDCDLFQSIVFIMDSQDEYMESIPLLCTFFITAYTRNPKTLFNVFIHKVDLIPEDLIYEIQSDIQQRISEELSDCGYYQMHIEYHQTSIFDHRILEAMSQVVQKGLHQFNAMTKLLDSLCSTSEVEKCFLFEGDSKICLASDSSPTDSVSMQLGNDGMDLVDDFVSIYGSSSRDTFCTIRLSGGVVLFFKRVLDLVLVCILKDESNIKIGGLEYNLEIVAQVISALFS